MVSDYISLENSPKSSHSTFLCDELSKVSSERLQIPSISLTGGAASIEYGIGYRIAWHWRMYTLMAASIPARASISLRGSMTSLPATVDLVGSRATFSLFAQTIACSRRGEWYMLRAADRYACINCESTAYSIGTVYGGKGHLYTPGVRPASLATPRSPCWRRPASDALLG